MFNFIKEKSFTIRYLRLLGFDADLYELGFSDLFYESILKYDERFYSQKNKFYTIFSSVRKPSMVSVAKELIAEYKIIGTHELNDLMAKEFGFYMIDGKKTALGFDLQGNSEDGMYYSKEMEKIYADKNDYYAEVENYDDII